MTFGLTSLFREVASAFSQDENRILLGQKSGSISGLQERSGIAETLSGSKQQQEKADKKLSDFLEAINNIQDYIKRLNADIASMEQDFKHRDGDAWREKLALKILDEDDIPQRREGESMTEYRERLEPLLIAEMLNTDGSIKSEYKNHPELGDYAEWAQKQYYLNAARGYVQELESSKITPHRVNEILHELEQRSDFKELTSVDALLNNQDRTQAEIKNNIESVRDSNTDIARTSSVAVEFLK